MSSKRDSQGDRMAAVKQFWIDDDVRGAVVSGRLEIGCKGNPVTIMVEDEVTGEILEINNVKRALLMIEDSRKSSSGWLSLVIGEVEKVSQVLSFLNKMTLEQLKKMIRR